MTRALNRLTALAVKKATGPAALQDGGGLMLRISHSGSKFWVLRIQLGKKRSDVGLGGYPAVSLENARKAAQSSRERAMRGEDPSPKKAAALQRSNSTDKTVVTFRDVFEDFFQLKKKSLSNGKHIWQWTTTMEMFVFPVIGDRPVAEIGPSEIVTLLTPIWHEKAETARRTLMRVRNVFDAAIVQGLRDKANRCTGVDKVLGSVRRKVEHHKALPWRDVPQFMEDLHNRSDARESTTRLLLEWSILHASRPGEARGALWCEIDEKGKTWTIPGDDPVTGRRMKGGEPHVVPLSDRALAILLDSRRLAPKSELIFPSRAGAKLSDMTMTKLLQRMKYAERADPHGFRSTFKDWCADQGVRDEVSEAALAHKDTNKVRGAYRRTDYLVERRELMQRWADYISATTKLQSRKRKESADVVAVLADGANACDQC